MMSHTQEHCMFTSESPHTCHRSNAIRRDSLSSAVFPSKSIAERLRAAMKAAAGEGLNPRGMQPGGSVMDFDEHPYRIHSLGPNASSISSFTPASTPTWS
jgi:hypothetical protein